MEVQQETVMSGKGAMSNIEHAMHSAVEPFEALGSGLQSCAWVTAFGALFLLMEFALSHLPTRRAFVRLLQNNPRLSKAEIDRCVPLIVTRIVGFIHNAVQVPIAVWAITNPKLREDRFYGNEALSYYMLCAAAGFFLHDAASCLLRESPFYIIHGLTCCAGYASGAIYGVGHFYGGLFLMWECSTPFVQLRWILYKAGLTETLLYKANGFLMVASFGVARILFGTYFTFLLLSDTYAEIKQPRPGSTVPQGIWIGFCAAAVTVSCLNYYWFLLMLKTLTRIFSGKQTWTTASHDKVE